METLTEGDVSLSSEAAKSQALMPSSSNVGADSESEPGDSVVGAQENGVRVSASDKEGLNGGGNVVITTRTQISVETSSFGARNGGVLGEEVGFLGDAKVTGGRQHKGEHGGGSKSVKSLDSVLGVEKNVENGGEKTEDAHGNSALLIGDGSDRNAEFDGNGISLVVEVHGSLGTVNTKEKKCGYGADEGSLAENGGDPSQKFAEMPGTMSKMGKNGDVTGVKRAGKEMNATEENEDEQNGDGDEEDEEDMDDQEHEFSVGDFVWGKIRSHPWWPGQIYDPSDASEYAAKYNQRDRLLVAYFGDGSFSWCSPSQLHLFEENFEEMSQQSNSKNFVNAVQKALDEIGRLVELKMTCSCVQEENRIGLTRPLAMNAGIKRGVPVPEGGIGRLSIPQRQAGELLAILRCTAQVVSITSMLDLTVLKSWLSAFYRQKGGYQLATYHESLHVEGLEDKRGNGIMDMTDLNGPVEVSIEGPLEEDWLSSPVSPGFSQSLLQKCPGISQDKLYQRRKQKSVAELMGEDMDVGSKNKEAGTVEELTRPGKLASSSGKKKRKNVDEAESQVGSDLNSPAGRKRGRGKKVEILGSPKSAGNKVSSVESGGTESEKETKKGSASREGKKKKKVSGVGSDDDGRAKEETEMVSASREKKKSKYLSPPYTNTNWRARDLSSKSDPPEGESLEVAKAARMGERMTRAAGQLIGSPPIVKCSGETFEKKPSKEADTGGGGLASAISSPQTLNVNEDKQTVKINASPNEVLSKVRSAALNPLYLQENKAYDMIRGFLMTFRSSIYSNGSNYKMYHKHRPGRKRKSLNPEPGSQGEGLKQKTEDESSKSKSGRTGNEKQEEAKRSDMPKLEQAARASGKKTDDKETSEKASLPTLMVTFPPGFCLPSKDDLMAIFSKFGALDEMETDVLYNSCCARVVFMRSCDADQAFKVSLKKSPFGAANVNYRLRSAHQVGRKASSPSPSPSPSVDEASQLLFIRQKLEMMTSMLEKSDGKMSPELKSNLEGEMKGLLEKVSTMASS
uniref:PWWP domain-containing protein n=1 Tax=Davidia involucrata TaxID=16924 RepID=A0A5B6YSA2_DAVIN